MKASKPSSTNVASVKHLTLFPPCLSSDASRWRCLLPFIGSCLISLGLGVSLTWGCFAFRVYAHLYPHPVAPAASATSAAASFISKYSSSIWPVLFFFFGFLAGLPWGALLDRWGGPRVPCLLGSSISFAAAFSYSFYCSSGWALLLLLGVARGFGCGLLLFPAAALPSRWFTQRGDRAETARCSFFVLGFALFAPIAERLMGIS